MPETACSSATNGTAGAAPGWRRKGCLAEVCPRGAVQGLVVDDLEAGEEAIDALDLGGGSGHGPGFVRSESVRTRSEDGEDGEDGRLNMQG